MTSQHYPAYSRPRPMNEIERAALEAEPEDRWPAWKTGLTIVIANLIAWPLLAVVGYVAWRAL